MLHTTTKNNTLRELCKKLLSQTPEDGLQTLMPLSADELTDLQKHLAKNKPRDYAAFRKKLSDIFFLVEDKRIKVAHESSPFSFDNLTAFLLYAIDFATLSAPVKTKVIKLLISSRWHLLIKLIQDGSLEVNFMDIKSSAEATSEKVIQYKLGGIIEEADDPEFWLFLMSHPKFNILIPRETTTESARDYIIYKNSIVPEHPDEILVKACRLIISSLSTHNSKTTHHPTFLYVMVKYLTNKFKNEYRILYQNRHGATAPIPNFQDAIVFELMANILRNHIRHFSELLYERDINPPPPYIKDLLRIAMLLDPDANDTINTFFQKTIAAIIPHRGEQRFCEYIRFGLHEIILALIDCGAPVSEEMKILYTNCRQAIQRYIIRKTKAILVSARPLLFSQKSSDEAVLSYLTTQPFLEEKPITHRDFMLTTKQFATLSAILENHDIDFPAGVRRLMLEDIQSICPKITALERSRFAAENLRDTITHCLDQIKKTQGEFYFEQELSQLQALYKEQLNLKKEPQPFTSSPDVLMREMCGDIKTCVATAKYLPRLPLFSSPQIDVALQLRDPSYALAIIENTATISNSALTIIPLVKDITKAIAYLRNILLLSLVHVKREHEMPLLLHNKILAECQYQFDLSDKALATLQERLTHDFLQIITDIYLSTTPTVIGLIDIQGTCQHRESTRQASESTILPEIKALMAHNLARYEPNDITAICLAAMQVDSKQSFLPNVSALMQLPDDSLKKAKPILEALYRKNYNLYVNTFNCSNWAKLKRVFPSCYHGFDNQNKNRGQDVQTNSNSNRHHRITHSLPNPRKPSISTLENLAFTPRRLSSHHFSFDFKEEDGFDTPMRPASPRYHTATLSSATGGAIIPKPKRQPPPLPLPLPLLPPAPSIKKPSVFSRLPADMQRQLETIYTPPTNGKGGKLPAAKGTPPSQRKM